MFRVHLGDDDTNRFGSRIVSFLVPLVVHTPTVRVVDSRRFADALVVDVALDDADFLASMVRIDDQLLAAADALGRDPWCYRPLVKHINGGPVMKIKLGNGKAPPPRAKFTIRMDHVWFVGDSWGVTWRAA